MADKDKKKFPVTATFQIVLSVNCDLGAVSVEDALNRARSMKCSDVLDLQGIDVCDEAIRCTGVFETGHNCTI